MKIEFKKHKTKSATLSITRIDGTQTWSTKVGNLVPHDLCHFAVETILELENSFYGMLAQGADIQNFEIPNRGERPVLSEESVWTEFVVNQFQSELFVGAFYEDFNAVLRATFQEKGLKKPTELTENHINQIRVLCRALVNQWDGVEVGKSLVLKGIVH